MSRNVKRVPLDFDWPMKQTWPGYLLQFCDGISDSNIAHFARLLQCKYEDASDLTYYDPPTGDGWQMWEDCSEGSPISPVFDSPQMLAKWLVDNNASAFGSLTATYEQWMATINRGFTVGLVVEMKNGACVKLQTGVEANHDR